MFLKEAEALEKMIQTFKDYKEISNLTISKEKNKNCSCWQGHKWGWNKHFKKININEDSIRKEIKFLGHIINMSYVSNDKLNTNMIAAKFKKNVLMGIAKCQRNLKLTIIGRGTAARALAVCHVDKSALYKLTREQVQSTQQLYDRYVVGNTKIGRKRSKYTTIEKGGAG